MDLMFQTIFQLSQLLAGKMTDLVSYLCAFLEINRAANVRLVRYSLLHPLAGNVHRDTRTFTGCFASTRLFRIKIICCTVSTVV